MPLVAPLAGLGGVVDATAAGFPQMAPIVGAALLWDTWNAWSAKRNGLCDECGRKVEDKKSTPCLGYFDCCPRMVSGQSTLIEDLGTDAERCDDTGFNWRHSDKPQWRARSGRRGWTVSLEKETVYMPPLS